MVSAIKTVVLEYRPLRKEKSMAIEGQSYQANLI